MNRAGRRPAALSHDRVYKGMAEPWEDPVQEAKRKVHRLRVVVDRTTSILYQKTSLTLEEGCQLVRDTTSTVLTMFPDKQQVYDLVLMS